MLRAGIIAIVAIVLHVQAHGQTHPIFNGIESACTGAFLDSGGQGAGGYGNNENYTYTLCPDVAGGAISLNFITFNLSLAGAAPVDGMTIHDGNSTAAPVLGTWTGSGLQGQVVSASSGNTSGCLTVVFHSNNTGTGSFAATISCYQPCIRPIAAAMYGSAGPMMICPGEAVTFNSSASTAAPGFSIASRTWDFGDGTILNNAPVTVSHTYTQPGAYTAQLYLLDNNGCSSTNLVDLVTLVGTTPNFNSMAGALGCGGETLCIDGAVNPTTWTETPDNGLGSGVFLPDNVGECFPTTLTFTQFAPGQTLTNVNQLLDICVNMEHSFMGDLIIRIISPNGQTVVLHQQGGGGTYLGVPVDNDATPNIQGTCWTYCWSPTATNGTWAANSGGTLPSGTYESVNPLSGLLGSPLNGTWTFEICDMWGIDNGFICDWSMEFDPALYPGLTQFTPLYGAACDSSFWTGPNITSTSADCNQFCTSGLPAGNHSFTYTVTDNFGCTYDTTVVVTIVPDLTVDAGPDQSTCGTAVQLNATCSSGGFPTSCEYELWLFDSFGDGWNANAYITVTIDGVSTNWTMPNGSAGFTTIQVPDGASIVLTYFRGGLFSNEQSFQLINSSGTVVYTGNNPPNGVVWTGTADCPDAGITYQWSPTTGLSDPSIANPTATVSTTSTYCVTAFPIGHPDCAMTDCMTITVDDPVDPGTNGSITVCANSAAFNLFTQLGGTPATGGTWTDPTGNAHGALFTPGTDPGGIYTYTVTGVGACGTSTASATVTVAVNTPPDAGTPGSITLCAT
ncbi:MAG: PKD domain-containing protein, partial [Flavobacteriales bacterium]|nr:PKD domain-containing protein [Flavobacteriales bacterium]